MELCSRTDHKSSGLSVQSNAFILNEFDSVLDICISGSSKSGSASVALADIDESRADCDLSLFDPALIAGEDEPDAARLLLPLGGDLKKCPEDLRIGL